MSFPSVLPIREQARIVNQTLGHRLEHLLPAVMRETGFDAWLIIGHEDNHDPVFNTMVPMEVWAPILQVLLFYDNGSEIERINISRTSMLGLMPPSTWEPLGEKDQWQLLRDALEQRSPKRIGINTSDVIWAADGLTSSLKARLFESIGGELASRCQSAEPLCIRWLETRLPEELELYEQTCAIAHAMMRQIYSRDVITPGVTTTEDLEWAYWQLASDLGLPLSFKPFYRLYRDERIPLPEGSNPKVIHPGDMLHCDVGVEYLRLKSDHQELAYVLRPGETAAPEGLTRGLHEANRLEDIFTESWECGLSGNAILERALQRAHAEGLSHPKIYSHSLGHLLHEPGPLMGLPWQQTAIAGRGDVVMHENTAYTVELRVDVEVPEWGNQLVAFPVEQDAAITADGVHYIDGRQTELHLV
ncbi:M24 family metallopeptidase [Aeoliella sp.]|uniref:M24 family metallopeptidase n=1 Tax=Aeoliella sp. TaxID=2795800 RepID=UPI003CCC0402